MSLCAVKAQPPLGCCFSLNTSSPLGSVDGFLLSSRLLRHRLAPSLGLAVTGQARALRVEERDGRATGKQNAHSSEEPAND